MAQSVPMPITLLLFFAQLRDTYHLYEMVTHNNGRSQTER